jgi:hypothetical protein
MDDVVKKLGKLTIICEKEKEKKEHENNLRKKAEDNERTIEQNKKKIYKTDDRSVKMVGKIIEQK